MSDPTQTLEVIRLENDKGIGPWTWPGSEHFDLFDEIGDKIPTPNEDFDYGSFQAFCENRLGHRPDKCFFGFPNYESFKQCLGGHGRYDSGP